MKTAVITGTTSGVGLETAKGINAAGNTVVMLNRNPEKAEKVKSEMPEPSHVECIHCDLADLQSVKKAADQVKAKYTGIDILINNAGGIIPQKQMTKDGFELTFQMNQLSHFVLTYELIPLLAKGKEPRIITLSSEAHRAAKPDFDDLECENGYASFTTYANAKLFNLYFARQLSKELKHLGIAANALHPGVVNTGFGDEYTGVIGFFIKLIKPFLIGPKKGAQTSLHLALHDEGYEKSGLYFKNKKVTKPHKIAYNDSFEKRLKEESIKRIQQTLKYDPTENVPEA